MTDLDKKRSCHAELVSASHQPLNTGETLKRVQGTIKYRMKQAFTLSCKTFRSRLLRALRCSHTARRSQTKFRNCVAHSYGFTLTEVIVVIVIIAALALILIPNMLSMMPNDHNSKYKKAFYTIQEIVNDIAKDCQGYYVNSGERYSIEEWNDDHTSNQLDSADNVLSFCYKDDDTPKYLDEEICKRLNTIDSCSLTEKYDTGAKKNVTAYWNIRTTNGMKWVLPHRSMGGGKEWDCDNPNCTDIYVSFDGKDIDTIASANAYHRNDAGIYVIRINSHGKVIPVDIGDELEKKLLLDNPTKD